MSAAFNGFIYFGQTSLEVLQGAQFVELPLERLSNGQLTDDCRARVIEAMRTFFASKGWRTRPRVLVALGARGVLLRRMTLPAADREESRRLLQLQIEAEFPLPPDELAWGFQLLGKNAGRQEALVTAVKKEVVEAQAELLRQCGVDPFFTLAALARLAACSPPIATCVLLDVGPGQSELLLLQDAVPTSLRLVPLSGLAARLNVEQVYLTGLAAKDPAVVRQISEIVGPKVRCSLLESNIAGDRSATLAGLQKLTAPLLLQSKETKVAPAGVKAVPWKWAATAALLLLALLFFPYLEALAMKPHLEKKLAAFEVNRGRLPAIDRELGFLQYIKESQPPYLDTLYLIAKAAPPGTVLESVAMTRRGDLSIRARMGSAQQVTELRTKLIDAGWFSSVVVDEQTPNQNRQVTVRMTAMLKPPDSRSSLPAEGSAAKPERQKK